MGFTSRRFFYVTIFFLLQCSFQGIASKHFVLTEATESSDSTLKNKSDSCSQINCDVWVRINVTRQRLYLYQNGNVTDTFKVSTGDKKHETPNMERHPSGPMYVKYTSKKFPGGNYMGLGNMPYVTFIRGGYAIHGTTPGNFKKLGYKASHGCIRLHPSNAKKLFELIKSVGLSNVWISIER